MVDQLVPVLVFFLVIGLLWILLKLVLKFTAKVFTCGCAVILVIVLIVAVLRFVELPGF